MCGRYFVDIEFEELMKRYNIHSDIKDINSRIGEVYPSNNLPVIIHDGSSNRIEMMDWGFNMSFMNKLLINARSETAHEKRSFKNSLFNKRCIVPASGFYEWRTEENRKIKYYIKGDREIISFAGLYQDFLVEDQWRRAFVILTKASDQQMAEIHQRIPVFINENDESLWLDRKIKDLSILNNIIKRPDAPLIIEKV